MKTNATSPSAAWLDRLIQLFGSQTGLSPANGGLPLAASETYVTYFRKYHPPAAAPQPARGWIWTEDDRLEMMGESA